MRPRLRQEAKRRDNIAQITLRYLQRKGGKGSSNPLFFQLLMAPQGPFVRACREKNLHLGLREYHGAHIPAIRHQARGYGKAPAGDPGARRGLRVCAATLEASFPASSVRMSPEYLPTVQPDDLLPGRIGAEFDVDPLRQTGQAPAPSSRLMPAVRPARATKRYRAPLSSNAQPSALAAARLTVPLPDPEGPSMVMTGTGFVTAHSCSRIR